MHLLHRAVSVMNTSFKDIPTFFIRTAPCYSGKISPHWPPFMLQTSGLGPEHINEKDCSL